MSKALRTFGCVSMISCLIILPIIALFLWGLTGLGVGLFVGFILNGFLSLLWLPKREDLNK